jgi:hypothetical protein
MEANLLTMASAPGKVILFGSMLSSPVYLPGSAIDLRIRLR